MKLYLEAISRPSMAFSVDHDLHTTKVLAVYHSVGCYSMRHCRIQFGYEVIRQAGEINE
jgi:hypothetical protein